MLRLRLLLADLLLALLGGSCGAHEWHLDTDGPYTIAEQECVIAAILDDYRDVVGDDAIDAAYASTLTIAFSLERIPCGVNHPQAWGCYWPTRARIEVYARGGTLADTSLAHELLHFALDVYGSDEGTYGLYGLYAPDQQSMRDEWNWIIEQAQAAARSACYETP